MLRVVVILLALCCAANSEESSSRKSETKTEAAQNDNQHGSAPKQITVPANSFSPTIINIGTGKHSGQESHCTKPKDWKGWATFAWCMTDDWLDAERTIAIFMVILAVSTIGLWLATRKLWKASEAGLANLERAFIFVKNISLTVDRDRKVPTPSGNVIGGQPQSYRIAVNFENSGQTPAVRVVYNFNCKSIGEKLLAGFSFPDIAPANRGVLGPKATLAVRDRSIPAQSISDIVSGKARWFIWGWVDYDDIFDKTDRHRTEFCFEVAGSRLPSGDIFISFPMHDRFNATDKDCLRRPEAFPPK